MAEQYFILCRKMWFNYVSAVSVIEKSIREVFGGRAIQLI